MEQSRATEILNDLNNPEVTEDRKSELMIEIKSGLESIYGDANKVKEDMAKMQKVNSELQVANYNYYSKLTEQKENFEGHKEKEKIEAKKKMKLSDVLAGK